MGAVRDARRIVALVLSGRESASSPCPSAAVLAAARIGRLGGREFVRQPLAVTGVGRPLEASVAGAGHKVATPSIFNAQLAAEPRIRLYLLGKFSLTSGTTKSRAVFLAEGTLPKKRKGGRKR